jgi:hypothetical protein
MRRRPTLSEALVWLLLAVCVLILLWFAYWPAPRADQQQLPTKTPTVEPTATPAPTVTAYVAIPTSIPTLPPAPTSTLTPLPTATQARRASEFSTPVPTATLRSSFDPQGAPAPAPRQIPRRTP